MAWYLAPSLAVLRAEVNSRWPGRDRTSDGSIGDTAHVARSSDHNPNSRGSVNAIDIDEDGVDVAAIKAAIQAHPSAHYWIYERRIADRDNGWRPVPYTGSNPHDKHLHVSIRQTQQAEQDRRPWGLLEDDVSRRDALLGTRDWFVAAQTGKPAGDYGMADSTAREAKGTVTKLLQPLTDRLDGLEAKVDALAATPPGSVTITDEQLERVLRRVLGTLDGATPESRAGE